MGADQICDRECQCGERQILRQATQTEKYRTTGEHVERLVPQKSNQQASWYSTLYFGLEIENMWLKALAIGAILLFVV